MGEKIIIVLMILILGCLSLITYKVFIDPSKVIFVPVIPDENIPIAPAPSWPPSSNLRKS